MKRRGLFALMILLFLSGCAGRGTDEFETWREALSAQESISFAAAVIAGDEETRFSFGVEAEFSDGETCVTVTAPETISGLRFHRAADGDRLEYDGAVLVLPQLGSECAPCEAPPILFDALLRGETLCTGREKGCLTAVLTAPGGEIVSLWRTEEDKRPIYAEIAREGQPCMQLRFSNWQ